MKVSFWKKKRVLITSGPTREFLDPIRFLTNASSGKMGWALAAEAKRLGAEVVVVSGPVNTLPPLGIKIFWVESALQMREKTIRISKKADVVIAAAAVTDWRPETNAPSKIKKKNKKIRLTLIPNPDIIREVGEMRRNNNKRGNSKILVGFALETEKMSEFASKKLKEKGLDMIVANSPVSLTSEQSRATLIFNNGRKRNLPLLSKKELARVIFSEIEKQNFN